MDSVHCINHTKAEDFYTLLYLVQYVEGLKMTCIVARVLSDYSLCLFSFLKARLVGCSMTSAGHVASISRVVRASELYPVFVSFSTRSHPLPDHLGILHKGEVRHDHLNPPSNYLFGLHSFPF
jgi:hypothetical protein